MTKLLSTVILLIVSQGLLAQQNTIQLAREDIRAGRMGIIIASMGLTEEQQQKFWPIYRDYADEQDALLDERIALLQQFAANRDSMTDELANTIAQKSFALSRSRLERRERYFKRFSEALGPVLAARFTQIDGQLATLMDYEMARSTPLIGDAVQDE